MAPLTVFQRNPRNVRIAAWTLAIAAAAAWYKYDEKKAREFSASELQQWNQDVLRKNPSRSRKNRDSSTPHE